MSHCVPGFRGGRLAVLLLTICPLLGLAPASAQTPAPAPWAGWARCEVDVQGPGYSSRQIHTWTITGATPTVEGAFRVYPGNWSVVGGGSLQRTQGSQTLIAQWAINVATASAPLAVVVRASDGRMLIQSRHAQLRSAGAVAGFQQQIIDGVAQRPGPISAEAFEWPFPAIDAPATTRSVSGSSTPAVTGSVGLMQPGGSRGTAACSWTFGQGDAAPAPPPTLAAAPVPAPQSTRYAGAGAPARGQTARTPPSAETAPTATVTPNQRTTTSPPDATATAAPNQRTTTLAPEGTTPAGQPGAATGAVATRAPGLGTPPITGSPATRGFTDATCTMPAPVLNQPQGNPGTINISWTHLPNANYSVYRSDAGLLNATPLSWDSALGSYRTITYSDRSPHYATTTYAYTVVANYPNGCGRASVSVPGPRPFVPELKAQPGYWEFGLPNGLHGVLLTWTVPDTANPPFGDNNGFLVLGPDLPAEGRQEYGCGPGTCYFNFWQVLLAVPSGDHTWLIAPYWDTPNGRAIDMSLAGRVTYHVP